jgi:hypothetical protein
MPITTTIDKRIPLLLIVASTTSFSLTTFLANILSKLYQEKVKQDCSLPEKAKNLK